MCSLAVRIALRPEAVIYGSLNGCCIIFRSITGCTEHCFDIDHVVARGERRIRAPSGRGSCQGQSCCWKLAFREKFHVAGFLCFTKCSSAVWPALRTSSVNAPFYVASANRLIATHAKAANGSWPNRLRTFAASDRGSALGATSARPIALARSASTTAIPSSPSANASGAPAAARPSAGVPLAMASRNAIPKPSPVEGITKRSAIRYASTRVSCETAPMKRTRSPTPASCARTASLSRSSPSPSDDVSNVVAFSDELRNCRNHAVVPLVSLTPVHSSHGEENTLALKPPRLPQSGSAPRREGRIDGIRQHQDTLRRDCGPIENTSPGEARHAEDQIRRLDRSSADPRRPPPRLDPMRLDDQLRALEARDDGSQRGHIEMATEDDIDAPPKGSIDGPNTIADPPGPRFVLDNSIGRGRGIHYFPRQQVNRRYCASSHQCTEEIAIILCDPTAPAECVSNKRKYAGRRYHTAWASASGLPDPASTRRDQRRDTRPFGSASSAAGAPAAEAIQAPVGTPNPVFARLTILSGKESEAPSRARSCRPLASVPRSLVRATRAA